MVFLMVKKLLFFIYWAIKGDLNVVKISAGKVQRQCLRLTSLKYAEDCLNDV